MQLSVTKRVHLDKKLVWRLEGEELSDFEGSETVTLVNVEPAEGGVYECHYRGERDAKLHAWIRLAVAGELFSVQCTRRMACRAACTLGLVISSLGLSP